VATARKLAAPVVTRDDRIAPTRTSRPFGDDNLKNVREQTRRARDGVGDWGFDRRLIYQCRNETRDHCLVAAERLRKRPVCLPKYREAWEILTSTSPTIRFVLDVSQMNRTSRRTAASSSAPPQRAAYVAPLSAHDDDHRRGSDMLAASTPWRMTGCHHSFSVRRLSVASPAPAVLLLIRPLRTSAATPILPPRRTRESGSSRSVQPDTAASRELPFDGSYSVAKAEAAVKLRHTFAASTRRPPRQLAMFASAPHGR